MDSKKITARTIAQDGMFCSLCIVAIFIVSLFAVSLKHYCFVVAVFFSIYFSQKAFVRSLISAIVVSSICFLFSHPLNVLVFIAPNCLIGCFCSKMISSKVKILIPIIFFVQIGLECIAYSYLFLGKDIVSYYVYVIKSINESSKLLAISDNPWLFLLFFSAYLVVASIAESVVYFLSSKLLNEKIGNVFK